MARPAGLFSTSECHTLRARYAHSNSFQMNLNEPTTPAFGGQYSIHLSYGRIYISGAKNIGLALARPAVGMKSASQIVFVNLGEGF